MLLSRSQALCRRLLTSHGPSIRRSSSSVASTSVEKMETDKRYQRSGTIEVPSSLLNNDSFTSQYSIRGKFREGRAAYLDHSATTPLDPRVLDAMEPYMVRQKMIYLDWSQSCATHGETHNIFRLLFDS
jgi:hypothetical protein